MTLNRDEIAAGLEALIALNKESAKGFVRAENDVEDEALASLFNRLIEERSEMVDDLERAARGVGEAVEEEATTGGALARGWLNIKAAMTIEHERTDAIVLEDRLEHEAKVLKGYEEAVDDDYPPAIVDLLQKQLAYVRQVSQTLDERRQRVEERT